MPDVWTTRDLRDRGLSAGQISRLVSSGSLRRLRSGWYGSPDLDERTAAAVRAGGRLGCTSALAALGIWVLAPDALPHVCLPPHSSSVRAGDGIRRHWVPLVDPAGATRGRVGVVDALSQASRCLEPEAFVASVDSARHLGILAPWQLAHLRSAVSVRSGALLDRVDARAESGLESLMRVRLQDLGLRVRSQRRVAGVGRADLEVEGAVMVETDGDRWHDEKVTTRDRRRDAGFTRAGRTVLHFRYAQVVFEPADCLETTIAAVETHRGVRDARAKAARARARLGRMHVDSRRSVG